jgi:hypothetical protein
MSRSLDEKPFKQPYVATLVAIAVMVTVVVSGNAHASELSCKETFWGDTVCQAHKRADRPVGIRYTIKPDIWGDEVVRENGKVVARCKSTIFGTKECRGTQR